MNSIRKRILSAAVSLSLAFSLFLPVPGQEAAAAGKTAVSAGDIAKLYVSDSPTDGMYCSVSGNTLRHYENLGDDPYFENGGFMFGTTVGTLKAYAICVDFEDCPGAERVEYGDRQNVFVTEGMEYDYSRPETYYNTIFAGSKGFGDSFTGEQEYVGMIEYFRQVSYGMMNMEVEFINSLVPNEDGSWPWFRMPGEQSDWAIQYASDVEDYRTFGRLYRGALEAAYEQVPDLDIEDISFLYVITPVNTFGFRSGLQGGAGIETAFSYQDQSAILRDTEYRHEPLVTTKGGKVIGSGTTITKGARGYDGADRSYFRVMAHETSHGLGLIDDYTYSGTDHMSEDPYSWSRPVGMWGIMTGMTGPAPDWCAWYKYKAGWIADDEIEVVMPGETKEIIISALGSKEGEYAQGAKMVMIPSEWRTVDTFHNENWNPNGTDYNFLDWFTPVWLGGEEYALKSFPTAYVLECRRAVGADYLNTSGEPGTQGVLVSQLSNLTWETGHGAAGYKNMTAPGVSASEACIGEGDYAGVGGAASWEDTSRGIRVEVVESTEAYDRVRITYTGKGTGVDSEGSPVEVRRTYQGLLEASDAWAQSGSRTEVAFKLITTGSSADNGNRLTEEAPEPVITGTGSPLGVGSGVAACEMTVTYDPEALDFSSLDSPFDSVMITSKEAGILKIKASGPEMIPDSRFSLMFHVKEDAAPGEYEVTGEITDVDVLTFTGEAGQIDGVEVLPGTAKVNVSEDPVYTVSGTVTESRAGDIGVPAALTLLDEEGNAVAETVSGTHGHYAFCGIPAGKGYTVKAEKHLYQDTVSDPFSVRKDMTVDLQLPLATVTISGRVYADDVDHPLGGAVVQLVDGGFLPVGKSVRANVDGYYVIKDVPVMENDFYTLTARAVGFGNSHGQNYGRSRDDLFHATEDLADMDIFLSSSYLVAGEILGGDEEAVYQVQLLKDGLRVGDPVSTVTTKEENPWYGTIVTISYELTDVPAGEGYCIEVSGDGCMTRRSPEFMVKSTNVLQKNLEIEPAEEGMELTGWLNSPDGTPAAGIRISCGEPLGYGEAVTDEDGYFSIWIKPSEAAVLEIDGGDAFADVTQFLDLSAGAVPVELTLTNR